MVSEDHPCKVKETSDDFSQAPDTLDTPPFRFYGKVLLNGPPGEVRRSPLFRPSGRGLLGILPLD